MNPLMTDYPLSTQPTPVIVALDFANEAETLAFVRRLSPELCQLKIGKELFTATGRSLAEKLINQGFKLFLDLKYHDIPNTVAHACKVAAEMGVWLVDMHASGGRRMMEAAAEAVANCAYRPKLIGVTVLTSMTAEDLREIGLNRSWRRNRGWMAWCVRRKRRAYCGSSWAMRFCWLRRGFAWIQRIIGMTSGAS